MEQGPSVHALSDKERGDLGEAEATAKMMLALYLQTQYQVRVESMREVLLTFHAVPQVKCH